MILATLPDYEARYGQPDDEDQVEALLADASSLAQQAAGQDIGRVVDDVWSDEGNGSDLLQLHQVPVEAVTSITVAGVVLDASQWRLLPHGQIRRLHGCWPDGDLIEVTNTHGFDPVPGWIVSLVCSMVQRAVRPEALAGLQQQTTGSQSIAYTSTAAGANLWLTRDEANRLRSLFGPRIA